MKIKKIAAIIFSMFVVLCFTGCLYFLNELVGAEETQNDTAEKSDYTFNISKMPSDAAGMTVRVYSSHGDLNVDEYLGTVTDINKTLSNTVSLYSSFSRLEIRFFKDDTLKYYVPVKRNQKNSKTGAYDIRGYYYYAEPQNGLNAVIDASKIQTLEYGKSYEYNSYYDPYLIWKATGVKDKKISYTKKNEANAAVYFFTDLQQFIEGSKEEYKNNIYECSVDEDEIYVLICPKDLKSKASADVSFSLTDVQSNAFLNIDTCVLASNEKLYAYGYNSSDNTLCNLWSVDISSKSMSKVKEFGERITNIAELDPGILYVSHGKTISKVNLETNETTNFAVLDNKILAIENYKNDYIIAVCSNNPKVLVLLIEKATGDFQEISGRDESSNLRYINNFLYIPEIDMYIFDTQGISPNDMNYLMIDDSDPENLSYRSYDSQYHEDIGGPYTVLDTDIPNGKARVIASGEVYEIDRNAALSSEPTILNEWCKAAAEVSFIQNKTCYVLGENIYYASDNYYDVLVKKYSKTSTSEVLGSKTFKGERAVSFFYQNSQLYLVTNSIDKKDSNYFRKIYIHKIDF